MIHTFMTSCLRKLVRVCLAVISLTAFSHRMFKHNTIVTQNISRENVRQCFIFSAAVLICLYSSSVLLTHTHPFNGPFSGTTRVGRYQKGKTSLDFTEARDSEWHWHKLGHAHMQVCTSMQADNHDNPTTDFY